jgi:hypothetical protein
MSCCWEAGIVKPHHGNTYANTADDAVPLIRLTTRSLAVSFRCDFASTGSCLSRTHLAGLITRLYLA